MVPWSKNISLTKVAIMLGAATIFWTGLAKIIPDEIHGNVLIVIGALSATVTFLLDARKKKE